MHLSGRQAEPEKQGPPTTGKWWTKSGLEVRLGWVKAHMGSLGNEAADVLAKQAAEGVPLDDHEKCIVLYCIVVFAARAEP